jgi:hypothetical protein
VFDVHFCCRFCCRSLFFFSSDIASMDPATREMYQLEINSTLSSMPQATVFSATTTPALVGPQPQPQAEVENHVAAAPAVPTDYPIPYPVRADAPSELPLELTPIAKYHPLFDYTNQMYDNPRAHLYFLAYFKPYGFEWGMFCLLNFASSLDVVVLILFSSFCMVR